MLTNSLAKSLNHCLRRDCEPRRRGRCEIAFSAHQHSTTLGPRRLGHGVPAGEAPKGREERRMVVKRQNHRANKDLPYSGNRPLTEPKAGFLSFEKIGLFSKR